MPRNMVLVDYLKTRRSVGIGFLAEPGPTSGELEELLTIATRVPDHGKFAPWRLVIFEGEARAAAGEKLAAIARSRRPELDEASLDIERNQFLPAPLTVGVVLSPKPNPKAPELEQLLSAGNVCFNLEHAAHALGFAATWHTRWYAFDPEAQQALGARGGERFVGFIHIGTSTIKPDDRDRPALADIVSRWQPA
ncbi:MAG TPA: nitroreductase [Devosia sp.]|nr:nitroreductase [Devosia sp.]